MTRNFVVEKKNFRFNKKKKINKNRVLLQQNQAPLPNYPLRKKS
jgi:hypothetical protein